MPFYMGQREIQQVLTYWWRYSIRVENFGTERVQLRERHWNIYGLSGTLETTKGRGVIGQVRRGQRHVVSHLVISCEST